MDIIYVSLAEGCLSVDFFLTLCSRKVHCASAFLVNRYGIKLNCSGLLSETFGIPDNGNVMGC